VSYAGTLKRLGISTT